MKPSQVLAVHALRICQGKGRSLYSFAIEGQELSSFATISRIRREGGHEIAGYQRPEVLAHIAEIKAYLESNNPILPTSVVVALDESVSFEPTPTELPGSDAAMPGILTVPLADNDGNPVKVGWIVDGQQRAAAIREAKIKNFPVFVTGFIASSDKEQREQFILVNSPKPLPKDLIYELLPGTESKLPVLLQRRRFSAGLLARLNHDVDSPLRKLIRTHTNREGVIRDNSILRMIEYSLSDGALFRYRDPQTAEVDSEGMLRLLKAFWEATSIVFKDAWGLPPQRSRLMHGAGIIAMGLLMDTIAESKQSTEEPSMETFRSELIPLRSLCRWTGGSWQFADGSVRRWDEIQNISRDIQLLAMHLLTLYHNISYGHETEIDELIPHRLTEERVVSSGAGASGSE